MDARDELEIEIMRMGVEATFPVKFGPITILMRPLSNSEMVSCYSNAAEYVRTLPKAQQTELTENTWRAREFLKQSSKPFGTELPKLTDFHLDKMTNGQIMSLYKEWMAITERVNPDIQNISDERLKLIVETVKKNLPAEELGSLLTELSFGELRSLAHYLLTNGD